MDNKAPLRYRKLRIAWSIGWGVLCLMLIALWVRSYYWRERVVIGLYGNTGLQVGHVIGQVRVITFQAPGLSVWQPISSIHGRSKQPLNEWRSRQAVRKICQIRHLALTAELVPLVCCSICLTGFLWGLRSQSPPPPGSAGDSASALCSSRQQWLR